MSTKNTIPKDVSLDQVLEGLEKFVAELEDEVKAHHDHPEWMDFDEQCPEELNLIVRSGIIIDMLNGVVDHFKIEENHDLYKRIEAAKEYFANIG